MTELKAPPVYPDLDLRGFEYMPLDVVRLRDSEIAVKSSGDEFRAAVMLWCAAWHQVPASSLPDDDRLLANLAGFGRDIKGWLKVKAGALHGFELCSDGKLYHEVIAEKATDADNKRKAFAEKMAKARAGKASKAQPDKDSIIESIIEPNTGHKVREGKLSKKDSEAKASDASASSELPDPRKVLFDRSLPLLASLTGKTPSSVRALVGKWLKSCSDEAIHVVAAIDDAATDRVVDPIPWIEMRLKPRMKPGELNGQVTRSGITAVLDRKLAEFGGQEAPRDTLRQNTPRLLSHG